MRQVKVPGHAPILYGEAPFGWRLNADRSRLVMDDDEQRLLSVVRHMYLVQRLPMRHIVERLQRMGIVNRRGGPFGLSGVWEMIHRRKDSPPESQRRPRAGTPAKKRARKPSGRSRK